MARIQYDELHGGEIPVGQLRKTRYRPNPTIASPLMSFSHAAFLLLQPVLATA